MLHVPVVLFTDRMVSNCLIHLSMSQGRFFDEPGGRFFWPGLVCQESGHTGCNGVSKNRPWLATYSGYSPKSITLIAIVGHTFAHSPQLVHLL